MKLRYNFEKSKYDSYGAGTKFEFDTNKLYNGVATRFKFGQIYRVNSEYAFDKNLVFKGNARVGHFKDENTSLVVLNAKLDVNYKGIKNTNLNGNIELLDIVSPVLYEDDKVKLENILLTKLNLSANYSYKFTDKLTLTPRLNLSTNIFSVTTQNYRYTSIDIEPSLKADYRVSKSLLLTGKMSLPIQYETKEEKVSYKSKQLKTEFNIKYTW